MVRGGLAARLRSFFRAMTGRTGFEQDMRDELAQHLDERAADLELTGLSHLAARRQARMELGSLDTVREDCRQSRGLRVVDAVWMDTRMALRGLARAPGLAATVIGTVAICLGANLAIFAVVDAVLLRGLPFPAPDRLVGLFNTYPNAGVLDDGASITNYDERQGQLPALEQLAIYRDVSAVVGESGAATREATTLVSPEFFDVLGVNLGRGAAAGFAQGGAVVTEGFRRSALPGDPAAVGRTVRVDGVARTVVAVLPASFRFLSSEARVYLPLVARPDQRGPAQRHAGSNTHMIARLVPGATVDVAQAQIDAQNNALEASNPQAAFMAEAGFRTLVVPLRAHHVASARPTLLLLQAGALVLLLLGAVNLTNLLLVRATGRLREMAVRHALGVARVRIVSQVLVETTVLTLAGGVAGLAAGIAGIRGLAWLGAERLPMGAQVVVDLRLAVVAFGGAIALGLAIGLPIAWFHVRSHTRIAQQFEARGSQGIGPGVARARQVLSIAQVALAFVLLSSAGLLAASLRQAQAVAPGFTPAHVVTGRISLPRVHYASVDDLVSFTERVLEAVRREPGVAYAGIATNVPFSGNVMKSAASVAGQVDRAGQSPQGHYAYAVTGDYFAALGIPLREGRVLDEADSRRSQPACVVDEDFARHFWPNGGALGQQVFLGGTPSPDDVPYVVVGVVGPVKQADPVDTDAPGALYVPYARNADRLAFLVVRTSASVDALSGRLGRAVRSVAPDVPIDDVRTMETRLEDQLVTRRTPAWLAGIFATVALALTALGVYGLLAYTVVQQRRELALRMALGATGRQVRAPLVERIAIIVGAGCAIGLAGAWGVSTVLQTVLFDVQPMSVPVMTATAATVVVLALAASLLPLARATRVAPMDALGEA